MQQTELTVQVFDTLENFKKTLESMEFTLLEVFTMKDYYYCSLNNTENHSFEEIIKNSFLFRYVNGNDGISNYMIYKNKTFDKDGNIISESKKKIKISSADDANEILSLAGFNPLAIIEQEIHVYKKDDLEFLVQDVSDLGLFIEYEDNNLPQNLSAEEKIEILKNNLIKLNLPLGDDYFCKKLEMIINKKIEK